MSLIIRRMSLATAAILNSARMAMSQAGKMAERRKTMQRLEANDMETEEAVESDRMVQDNVESDVEPVTRHADFARPTPRVGDHLEKFTLHYCYR